MAEKFYERYNERASAPSFEEIDRRDPVAFAKARNRWVQERLVELETVKILRDRVTHCYRKEEVNSRQNCRKEVQEYMEAFTAYKAKGGWFK